jgi:hypothetical protein
VVQTKTVKTKMNIQIALMIAIALIIGLASIGARAEDTTTTDKPARPERPEKATAKGPNAAELKDIIKAFQAQKKEFLAQRKQEQVESRDKAREELGNSGSVGTAITEARDAINEAKQISREQARKLAEEAKESAKEGRKRD